MALQILLTLAILVPLGPMIYRIAYQPIAETSVLVLLIASVAVHLILTGLGLVFFGAEGARTAPFSEGSLTSARCRSTCRRCGWWAARWPSSSGWRPSSRAACTARRCGPPR
jgi:branched-subunit amino acid ABC-type transport system permease component